MIGDRKVEGGELVLDIIDNIVMLGSSMSLILLQENNHQLFCDGTFRFAPRGYYQLYSIHVLIGTVYTPVVHFLLMDKKCVTYKKMFQMLRSHCPDLHVGIFQMDFELAAQQAAAACSPSQKYGDAASTWRRPGVEKLPSLDFKLHISDVSPRLRFGSKLYLGCLASPRLKWNHFSQKNF